MIMKTEERIVQLLESIDQRMDAMVNQKRLGISSNVTMLQENNRKLEKVLADLKAAIARWKSNCLDSKKV